MSGTKGPKRKNVRPKSEVGAKHISQPFDFRHDLHVGQADYDERLVDTRPVSPPAPCPGNTGSSSDTSTSGDAVSQLLKEDLVPALSLEITRIVESTIARLLNGRTVIPTSPHCQTCTCPWYDDASIDDDLENPDCRDDTPSNISRRADQVNQAIATEVSLVNATGMKMVKVNNFQDQVDTRPLTKYINNPLYNRMEQIFLIQTQQGAKLVKYGSDLQLKHVDQSTHDHTLSLERSNTLPVVTKGVQPPGLERKQIQTTRKETHSSEYDKRECMAHAMQWHIHDIVGGVVFKDSELPDILLEDGCLTEEECSGVRQKLDCKDQARTLLCTIKGRDFGVLIKFLEHIRSHNADVAEKIQDKFEQNMKEGLRCSKCSMCLLTTQVNLKYLADSLWRESFIDDGLYCMIVDSKNPTGAQGDLWNLVIHSLNCHNPSKVRTVLVGALTAKNHYHHIAKGVEKMIKTNGELKCRCECPRIIQTARSITSLVSSRSPQTSETELRADSHSDISRISNQTDTANTTQLETEVRGRPRVKQLDIKVQTLDTTGIVDINLQDTMSMPQSHTGYMEENTSVKSKPPVIPRKKVLMKQDALASFELEASEV